MNQKDEESRCIVNTKDGPICGYIDKVDNKSKYIFKGIPYARPPINSLRFLPPQPLKPWTEVLDCTQTQPAPIHVSVMNELCGSEDCLYIELITPNLKPEKPLPVMFWIGSCCYFYLADSFYDPSFLIAEDIIFVRCGFRLGPFGFLSINDVMAPGNCGLKDIVWALKWVQNNIAKFGGDPGNVTLFGSSSGAASVHFMTLSPMASGLFHKAILQSASALNTCFIDRNPVQSTLELAKKLGCKHTCTADIIEFLRTISAKEIQKACIELYEKSIEYNDAAILDTFFGPCIEQDFEGQPAFLTKSPVNIIKSGKYNKVPFIVGSNNAEALILQSIKPDFYSDFQRYNENLHLLVPKFLNVDEKVSKCIGQELLKYYLDGEEKLTKDTKTPYLQLITDYFFVYFIRKTVQLHIQSAPDQPIYYYVLHQAGEWYTPQHMSFFSSNGHCAEVPYMFGIKESPEQDIIIKGSRDSVKTRKRMVKMWTNFAKYGDPTPNEDDPLLDIKWDPVESSDKLNYLCIGTDLTKGRNPSHDRMQFWDEIYNKHVFLRTLVYFQDMGITW